MTRWFFVFLCSLCLSVGAAHAEDPQAEQQILQYFANALGKLTDQLQEIETKTEQLRDLVSEGKSQKARRLANEIHDQAKATRQLWDALEKTYSSSLLRGLDLHHQRHRQFTVPHPYLDQFLAMKIHSYGLETGTPIEQLVRNWQALKFGTRSQNIPTNLKAKDTLGDTEIKKNDYILILFTNGGLVQGQVAGWTRNVRLVIREILPSAFSDVERNQGPYRGIELEEWKSIAAVELISAELAMRDAALSPFTDFGNYSSWLRDERQEITRIDLRLGNMETVNVLRKNRLRPSSVKYTSLVKGIEPWRLTRPIYPQLPFLEDCEAMLANRESK